MTFDLERARGLRDFLQDDCAEVGDIWGEMIAEIERLRAENEDLSKAVIDIQEERDLAQAEFRSYHRAWEEQAAHIQELEEALVEMVATNPCNIPTLCDVVHDELMCPALDGNCDFWKGCPQKNELREAARKQLQAEGKIGNGDHIAETDQMVPNGKVWQITEDQARSIQLALNASSTLDHRARSVLRAMLREAV